MATKPDTENRERQVSFALRAYASSATSADKGAVRDKSKLGVNDGRLTTLRRPEGAEYLRAVLRAPSSTKRRRSRRYKKWKTLVASR